jgi:hypothetical protein
MAIDAKRVIIGMHMQVMTYLLPPDTFCGQKLSINFRKLKLVFNVISEVSSASRE